MKYLLSETLTTAHHIKLLPDNCIALSARTHFELSSYGAATLKGFLRAVSAEPKERHTYTDTECILEYDPGANEIQILHKASDATISMSHFAFSQLLDALEGKTDQLLQEAEDGQ